jgi:antitoxin component YwqK of YwqJK toxin-antitoxin module
VVFEEHYPNGSVHIRREGKRRPNNVFINHGTWIEFDENGQKLGEMTYLDGVLHGPITLWHANGQKNGEGFFENGDKEGTWQIWDEQGRKIREESYHDGTNDGMWIYWDEEGNVIQYEHWIKGERQLETKGQESTAPPSTQPSP